MRTRESRESKYRKLTEEIVEESHGSCTECSRRATLGNGLCVRCWDKEIGKEFQRRYRGLDTDDKL